MKSITLILFAIIIIVGAIAIIITKLYYRNKEKKEKQQIEENLGINSRYPPRNKEINESRRFRRRNDQENQEIQRQNREIAAFSQTIPSSSNDEKIFDDYYGEPINSKFVNKKRSKDTANANMPKANVNKPINRNTPKTEEMERIINTPKTINNINDIKTEQDVEKVVSNISQAPMTDAHKDFIKEHKKGKLVIDSTGSGIKIVKNETDEKSDEEQKPTFAEIKRIKPNTPKETPAKPPVKEETPIKEEVDETPIKEEVKDTTPTITESTEAVKDDEDIEETLNKIMEDSNIETSPLLDEILKEINDSDIEKIDEIDEFVDTDKEYTNIGNTSEESIIKVVEEEATESEDADVEEKVENKPRVRKVPEFNKEELENGETTLFDHQEKTEDKDEEEPDDVITPIFNVSKGALKSLKSLKSNLLNENVEEDEVEAEESYIDEDYEDEFYSITPLSEEEIKKELQEETATITPINEDNVKEVKVIEEKTPEDDEKVKAKEELDKLRRENTKKLANMTKENEKSLASISKPADKTSKTSNKNQYQGPSEKIVIDGQSYELHKGLNIIFIYNNESYSSTILAMKPGFVGVKYRNKNVWVKNSRIKKVFKY
ncbi:MAG: hypothetical protein Q4P14_03595 [Methanobacteriaceae archaeon]|nr:hypothetical protein [Methanobacteriaceae archaeon]